MDGRGWGWALYRLNELEYICQYQKGLWKFLKGIQGSKEVAFGRT